MAIQHSRTITNLEVLNSGDEDVVSRVEVKFTSYDDSNPEETTIQSSESFELGTDDRTSSSEGWVAYDSLDAATIEGWLDSELTDAIASFQLNHTTWINSVLNPPAPATVNKTLPW
jgi:hypothetical protein|tara:strand:- start:1838 stop:2185 length:348 start_codon:yes stop_codon:yes gene_type:complete